MYEVLYYCVRSTRDTCCKCKQQVMQENQTLTKARADLNITIEDLKKQLAASEELVDPLHWQVGRWEQRDCVAVHVLQLTTLHYCNVATLQGPNFKLCSVKGLNDDVI